MGLLDKLSEKDRAAIEALVAKHGKGQLFLELVPGYNGASSEPLVFRRPSVLEYDEFMGAALDEARDVAA
jgi:hypothetical protein